MTEDVFFPTIVALDCGRLRQQERTLLKGGSTEITEIPVPAWLVRHPAGDVVFDAGLHPAMVEPEALGPMAKLFQAVIDDGCTVAAQLERHEVDAHGRFTVVVSHCHFDHVGGLVELPNAHIVVQADEWAAALAAGQAGGYDSALIDLGHDVLTVRGKHDVFGDGTVVCIPTPGHTCGHQSLRVQTEHGRTLLTADACYFTHTLDDGILPPFAFDFDSQGASLEWIRAERARGTTIVPGHDMQAFQQYLR
jgi:N-acyl homoserine lactone hydrolase